MVNFEFRDENDNGTERSDHAFSIDEFELDEQLQEYHKLNKEDIENKIYDREFLQLIRDIVIVSLVTIL